MKNNRGTVRTLPQPLKLRDRWPSYVAVLGVVHFSISLRFWMLPLLLVLHPSFTWWWYQGR